MQTCLVAEQWVCKRNEKSTAGAAQRASGDRLFFMKSAEGKALSQYQRLMPDGRDYRLGSRKRDLNECEGIPIMQNYINKED